MKKQIINFSQIIEDLFSLQWYPSNRLIWITILKHTSKKHILILTLISRVDHSQCSVFSFPVENYTHLINIYYKSFGMKYPKTFCWVKVYFPFICLNWRHTNPCFSWRRMSVLRVCLFLAIGESYYAYIYFNLKFYV
jgi:hypothetical protein